MTFSDVELRDLEADWNRHPGLRHMGATLDLSEPGVVRTVIADVRPHHRGGMGTDAVSGPVMAGLFDLAIGLLGYLASGGKRAGVAELHVKFLRPVHGARIEVAARPVRVGRNLVFADADLRDEGGTLCARADGIVAIVGERSGEPPAF